MPRASFSSNVRPAPPLLSSSPIQPPKNAVRLSDLGRRSSWDLQHTATPPARQPHTDRAGLRRNSPCQGLHLTRTHSTAHPRFEALPGVSSPRQDIQSSPADTSVGSVGHPPRPATTVSSTDLSRSPVRHHVCLPATTHRGPRVACRLSVLPDYAPDLRGRAMEPQASAI